MPEFRTQPLERGPLLAELAAVCEALGQAGLSQASVSFGWDSSLPIGEMWKDQLVPLQAIASVVTNSEANGISRIGKSDVFVESPGFLLTLCHEGDLHVAGESPLVQAVVRRWHALGYAPYELSKPDA